MSFPDDGRKTSCDTFYDGRFRLIQPKGWSLRAGLDAMLLAATVPHAFGGRAVDLGAGTGAAGFALAVRCPGVGVLLVERDPAMAGLIRRSLDLAPNAALAERLRAVEVDITQPRPAREAAGLFDGGFDLAISNPPFHPAGGRLSSDAARSAAVAMPETGFLGRWIAVAAALLAPRGVLALIARPDNLPEIFAACKNRLGSLRIAAVHTDAARPARRILVHARRGSRAPMALLPSLVLRVEENAPLPIERAVGEGTATIDLGLL